MGINQDFNEENSPTYHLKLNNQLIDESISNSKINYNEPIDSDNIIENNIQDNNIDVEEVNIDLINNNIVNIKVPINNKQIWEKNILKMTLL